jgi:hypothetical protein
MTTGRILLRVLSAGGLVRWEDPEHPAPSLGWTIACSAGVLAVVCVFVLSLIRATVAVAP